MIRPGSLSHVLARLRPILIAAIAVHSLALGLAMLGAPRAILRFFGFPDPVSAFFPSQCGLFLVVLGVCYVLALRWRALVAVIFVSKAFAVVFLVVHAVFLDAPAAVGAAAAGDAAMLAALAATFAADSRTRTAAPGTADPGGASKNPPRPARGVFFDLYGTLLVYGDMETAWSEWLTGLHDGLRRRGAEISRESLALRCDRFFTREWPAADVRDLTLFERRIHHLASEIGIALGRDEVRDIADRIARAWQRHVSLDPDAPAVLEALGARRKLALVSNYDHPPLLRSLLGELGLERFFEAIVISAEAGVRKPDPRIFDAALEKTGLRPGEVIYVGDSEEDVRASRAAGLTPIVIRRDGGTGRRAAADFRARAGTAEEESAAFDDESNLETVTSLRELLNRLG